MTKGLVAGVLLPYLEFVQSFLKAKFSTNDKIGLLSMLSTTIRRDISSFKA
jgi:hypothetical protein